MMPPLDPAAAATVAAPADDLAPDLRRFADTLAAGYAAHPPLAGLSLDAARAVVEQVRAPLTQGGPRMASTETLSIAPPGQAALRLRVHRPATAPAHEAPALVYVHGGGWVYFSLDTHDRLMRELAERAGRVVIGVDYTRSPEARFPLALHQVVAAWRWVQAGAATLGVDARRIALGGDSVGANLSVAAALMLREAGAGQADALLLNYGVYSDDDDTESFARFDGPRYTLERAEMREFWQQYLGDDAALRQQPLAMPLKAALHGLPRCCLVVAECDVLRDSSLALAARLQAAGVAVTLQRHAGAPHSFLEAMSFSPTAQQALAQSSAWLRREGA